MFKVFHNDCCTAIHNIFTKTHDVRPELHSTRQADVNFYVFLLNSDIRKYFMAHQGVIMWTALLNPIKRCNHIKKFKTMLKQDLLFEYA